MTEIDANEALIGAWKLLSWQIFGDDKAAVVEPFGGHPVGLLLYTADGWMSAAISAAGRPLLPAGISPRRLAAEPLADSFRTCFHYAGRWRLDGERVIHKVTLSLNPNMVGTEQVRQLHFDQSTLTLSGIEDLGQQKRRHVLRWQRASQTGNTLE